MKKRSAKFNEDRVLAGSRVLILSGECKGQEGVCLGSGSNPKKWAVSPDCTNEILELTFETEFALVIDLSGECAKN